MDETKIFIQNKEVLKTLEHECDLYEEKIIQPDDVLNALITLGCEVLLIRTNSTLPGGYTECEKLSRISIAELIEIIKDGDVSNHIFVQLKKEEEK